MACHRGHGWLQRCELRLALCYGYSKLNLAQLAGIIAALDQAQAVKGKPIFVNIRTIIGMSSRNQNTGVTHGTALGEDDVVFVKTQLGFNPDDKFVIPPAVYDYFAECEPQGEELGAEWNTMFERYKPEYPYRGGGVGDETEWEFG